jgi:hypothetical protein
MFLWRDPVSLQDRGEYGEFHAGHVNILAAQVDRHLSLPHEFVLVSDRHPKGLDSRFRVVPLDPETHVPGTRYAKLMLFRPDIGDVIGRRILYLDLDTVITGSMDDIAGRAEDLVLWRHPRWGERTNVAAYNTSVILMTAGVRPQVWQQFPRGRTKERMVKTVGLPGEDQAYITRALGGDEAVWTSKRDGIYYERQVRDGLPANARIVTFPGKHDPGHPETQARFPWIAEFRR